MSNPVLKFDLRALVLKVIRYLNRLGAGRGKKAAALRSVLAAERLEIRERRKQAGCPSPARNEPPRNLAGIALSGGGIRSATFCLGFLQALNRNGGLRVFDYLSTVSGGGFIGGWWSAWLTRQSSPPFSVFPPDEAVEPAREKEYLTGLAPDMRPTAAQTSAIGQPAPPVDPVHHVRLFSNYLTPRKGLLSGDTWRAVTVVGRNLVLTWLVLLPLLLAGTLVAHLYFVGHPDTAYGFACLTPRSRDAGEMAIQPDVCTEIKDSVPGQSAYLMEESYGKVLQKRLSVAATPILILGSWILAGVAAWILAGAASFWVMIGMMAGLLLTVVTVYGAARQFAIGEWTQDLAVQWDPHTTLMLAGAGTILLFWWVLPAVRDRRSLAGEMEPDNREARLNRVTRLQSVLLVTTALVGTVLLLGGFGHDLFAYLFTFSSGHPLYDYVLRAGGWSAVAATVAGLGATAFVSAPAGGGEQRPQPSTTWRNVVLAVTPVLTIVTLAIAASAIAHWLLIHGHPTPASSSGVFVMTPQGIVVIGFVFGVIQEFSKRRPQGTVPRRLGRLGLTVLTAAIAFLVPPYVAQPYRQLTALQGGLLLSVLVFTVFTVIEYLTDDRRTSVARRIFVLVSAVILSYLTASMLVWLGLFDGLQAFQEGPSAGQGPPSRRWSGVLVGAMVGLVFGRCCVTWLTDGKSVLVTKPWIWLRLRGTPVWLGLALAVIAGAGLGYLISDLQIPTDAMPIEGHLHSVGSPLLAWLCLLALSFVSCFVILDLLVSRDENSRALLLQIITLGLMGPTLLQQYLNPFGASVVFVNSSLALIGIALAVVVSLGWLIGPNDISLHSFYRARLVRAYLGASNAERRGRGIGVTESVRGDDLPLHSLTNTEAGGPYHIINATLNLVGGRDLATAQRSAASFMLSKLYCGSLRTGFRPTDGYMNGELTLGTAIAISGAAASPNMGSKTPSAALAMLLALLNIRLGFWAPTPNQARWRSPVARLWPYHLLSESLSQTNDVTAYAYLTDGGHFDNTGLYSLIERGCRYVVLVDCGADPTPCFADLGDAVRRCRIDFGTEIRLLVKDFVPVKDSGRMARWHYVAGTIMYSEEHVRALGWPNLSKAERNGVIVWVKPAIMADDPADVRQYALENDAFPQQSTSDQWFGEAQFESYRRLGEQCGADLAKAWGPVTGCDPEEVAELFRKAKVRYERRRRAAAPEV